jgi:hypothetical protein
VPDVETPGLAVPAVETRGVGTSSAGNGAFAVRVGSATMATISSLERGVYGHYGAAGPSMPYAWEGESSGSSGARPKPQAGMGKTLLGGAN